MATGNERPAFAALSTRSRVVFLPTSVANAVAEYRSTLVAITAPPAAKSLYDPAIYDAANPQMELTKMFENVWQVMRHQLGTEEPSKQTVKIAGTPPLQLDEGA